MRIASFALALQLLLACAPDRTGDEDAVLVRDSAGIALVDYSSADHAPPEWQLVELADRRLNGGGEIPFYRIRSIVSLPTGLMAVANAGSRQILWFDHDGEFISATGGQGAGPGEFRSLSGIHLLPPDSLLAYDSRLRRYQVFDSAGRYVRGFTLHGSGEGPSYPQVLVVASDGRILLRDSPAYDSLENIGVSRLALKVLLYDADGRFLNSVASVAGWEVLKPAPAGRLLFEPAPIPWGHDTKMAANSDGLFLVDNQTGEVRMLDLSGAVKRVFRPPDWNRPEITEQERASAMQQLFANAPPPAAADLRRAFADMPIPARKPSVEAIMATFDGNVWVVRTPEVRRESPQVVVLDRALRMLGALSLPDRVVIHSIHGGRAIGVFTDSLNVEQVRQYRIVR